MSRRVIIGIHGMGNKPKPRILEEWWREAIAEGMSRHQGKPRKKIRFELVYWADLLYAGPLDVAEMSEPYTPAEGSGPLPRAGLSVRKVTMMRLRGTLGKALERVSRLGLGERMVGDTVKEKMPDLHSYKNESRLKKAVQARLIGRLRSARWWGREVMVIAHSMGSIVAYDVLRNPPLSLAGLDVAHFVTVGSPLGLAGLKTVVEGSRRVPECVARWSNFSDPKDPVSSWDASIEGDYEANSRGVTVSDHLVANGYVNPEGKPNPHKIYGYLRSPEISDVIAGFAR